MLRFALAGLLAALPAAAHAGIGTTYSLGSEYSTRGLYFSPMWLPTLDIVNEGMVIQLHALDLLSGLTNEAVVLGGNIHFTTLRKNINESIGGVVQPGGSLDIVTDFDFDPLYLSALGLVRMGAQSQKGMGFGIYVVPGAGIVLADGDLELGVSGTLQVSAWMN